MHKILVISHLYLFPNHQLVRGGLIIHNSLKNLAKKGYQIHVIYPLPILPGLLRHFFNIRKGRRTRQYQLDGITIKPIFYLPRVGAISMSLELIYKKILLKRSIARYFKSHFYPDLIYAQTAYPDSIFAKEICENHAIPLMVTLRGSDIHTFCANSTYIREQVRASLKSSKLCLSVSRKLADLSKELFEDQFVNDILYTTCATEVFKKTKAIQPGLNRWIFVGALTRAKGVYELIAAFIEWSKRINGLQLILIGTGDAEAHLLKIIEKANLLSQVIFKGTISDRNQLAEELNDADIFVFPSYSEGLPNVVVEAVACERIVITSDVGGVKEISQENASFCLIETKKVESILSALDKIHQTSYASLLTDTEKNRLEVDTKFGAQVQSKKLDQLIKGVLDGKHELTE